MFLEFSRIFMPHYLVCTVVLHYRFLTINSKIDIFKQILIFNITIFLQHVSIFSKFLVYTLNFLINFLHYSPLQSPLLRQKQTAAFPLMPLVQAIFIPQLTFPPVIAGQRSTSPMLIPRGNSGSNSVELRLHWHWKN